MGDKRASRLVAVCALVAASVGCTLLGGKPCQVDAECEDFCVDGFCVDLNREFDAGPISRSDAGLDDAGVQPDGGRGHDAGPIDAGPIDAGTVDAGPPDAGFDAGAPLDAGPNAPDAGIFDAGPRVPVSVVFANSGSIDEQRGDRLQTLVANTGAVDRLMVLTISSGTIILSQEGADLIAYESGSEAFRTELVDVVGQPFDAAAFGDEVLLVSASDTGLLAHKRSELNGWEPLTTIAPVFSGDVNFIDVIIGPGEAHLLFQTTSGELWVSRFASGAFEPAALLDDDIASANHISFGAVYQPNGRLIIMWGDLSNLLRFVVRPVGGVLSPPTTIDPALRPGPFKFRTTGSTLGMVNLEVGFDEQNDIFCATVDDGLIGSSIVYPDSQNYELHPTSAPVAIARQFGRFHYFFVDEFNFIRRGDFLNDFPTPAQTNLAALAVTHLEAAFVDDEMYLLVVQNNQVGRLYSGTGLTLDPVGPPFAVTAPVGGAVLVE